MSKLQKGIDRFKVKLCNPINAKRLCLTGPESMPKPQKGIDRFKVKLCNPINAKRLCLTGPESMPKPQKGIDRFKAKLCNPINAKRFQRVLPLSFYTQPFVYWKQKYDSCFSVLKCGVFLSTDALHRVCRRLEKKHMERKIFFNHLFLL